MKRVRQRPVSLSAPPAAPPPQAPSTGQLPPQQLQRASPQVRVLPRPLPRSPDPTAQRPPGPPSSVSQAAGTSHTSTLMSSASPAQQVLPHIPAFRGQALSPPDPPPDDDGSHPSRPLHPQGPQPGPGPILTCLSHSPPVPLHPPIHSPKPKPDPTPPLPPSQCPSPSPLPPPWPALPLGPGSGGCCTQSIRPESRGKEGSAGGRTLTLWGQGSGTCSPGGHRLEGAS